MTLFTSGGLSARPPSLKLRLHLTNNEAGEVVLSDNPGYDVLQEGVNEWVIPISDFNFQKSCIWKEDIQAVAISNDGWNVESIATKLHDGSTYTLLTADVGVYSWVDGDYKLTLHQL